MPTYSGRIIREQGASVLNVASGGSMTFQSGAPLNSSGGFITTGGSYQFGTTGSVIIKPEATTLNNAVVAFQMGRNQFWYISSSAGSPIFSGSPGDLVWIAQSASTAIYTNRSNGTGGSNWTAVRLTTGSQLPGAI